MENDWRIEKLKNDVELSTISIESLKNRIDNQKLPDNELVEKWNNRSHGKVWSQQSIHDHILALLNNCLKSEIIEKEKLVKRLGEVEKVFLLKTFKKNMAQQRRIDDPKFFWTQKDYDREKGINVDAWDYGNNFWEMLQNSKEDNRAAQKNWYEDGGGGNEWSAEP